MTCNNTLASSRKPEPFVRALAFVLLVLVGYGAIAGAAHGHGNVTPKPRVSVAGSINIDSGDDRSPSKKLPNSGECLVCQFHQHLYSGLLGALPHVEAPVSQFAFPTPSQENAFSQTYAPRRGRAPPTSLS